MPTIDPTGATAPDRAVPLRADPPLPAPSTPSRRPWVPFVATSAASLLAVGYVWAIDPDNPANPYPQCITKHVIGLDCPLCGGLRGTHDLLHGNVGQALHHNALLVVVLPLLAYLLVGWGARLAGRDLPLPPHPRWLVTVGIVVVVAFTVARNIPGTPLYWLNSAAA